MKKFSLSIAGLFLMGLILMSSISADDKAATEKPWFDMKNCVFCKEITAQPGLFQHMKHEYHSVSNGLVSVLQVEPSHADAFKKAEAGMQAAAGTMSATKMPYMCVHCEKMGAFMMSPNIKMDHVTTNFGSITIYSSQDSATVAMVQAFGTRSNEEGKTMMAEIMKGEKK